MRLTRLGGLGPEALDEGFHLPARIVLALLQLQLQPLLLPPRLLETVVAAGVEGKAPLGKMQNAVDRPVEKIAVVAHHQHSIGIVLDEIFEPKSAFKIEIVRWLVEKQDVRRREERARQRHTHAPAAGEFRTRPGLRLFVEAEAGKDARRAGGRGVCVDVQKPRVDFADPVRVVRRLRLGAERGQLGMRGEHGFKQRLRPARRLLRNMRDGRVFGKADRAVIRVDLSRDQAQERGFAGAVAAHEAGLVPVRNGRRGVLEQRPPLDAV